MSKFAEVLEIRNGRNQRQVENPDGRYPIFGSGGVMGRADDYICNAGTVVIGRKGSINNPIYVDEPFWNVDTAFGLVANENKLLPKYLFYFCRNFDFEKLNTTVTIPSLTKENLLNVDIDLPSFPVQRRVAAVFDKVTVLIADRKRQLEQLDLLIKSQFVKMFGDLHINDKGWKIAPFSEFAKIDAVMTTDYEKYEDYPHIGIDSIESVTGELKGYRTVKQDGVKSGKYIFTPAHIIYSKIRPNLNKVALPAFEGLCSADAYPILNSSSNCDRVFLAYVLRSELFLSYVLPFSYRTNFPKVNREQISGFSMPLPSLPLQNRFADFVRAADKSKFELQRTLDELEATYKALLRDKLG